MLTVGQLWFNPATNTLYQWNGTKWVLVPFTTTAPTLKKGQNWYNPTNNRLHQWNGTRWVRIKPYVIAHFNKQGNIVFQTLATGSSQVLMIPIPQGAVCASTLIYGVPTGAADFWNDGNSPYEYYPFAGINNSLFDIPGVYEGFYTGLDQFGDFSGNIGQGVGPLYVDFEGPTNVTAIPYRAYPITANTFLWANLKPVGNILYPVAGQDGVSGVPTYDTLGVGTDGNPDARRNIMQLVRTQLGYPTVTVELTDTQLDRAVQNALETFRQRSSFAVYRACFFMDIQPFNQHYTLTN